MIKAFEVRNLNGSMNFNLTFHPDINIVTGRNGSGKTTLLKLIWYMLSSNAERTVPEIPFSFARLETDSFELTIETSEAGPLQTALFILTAGGKPVRQEKVSRFEFRRPSSKVERINRALMPLSGRSVFFPTFRRIEGGFSIQPPDSPPYRSDPPSMLYETLAEYARSMSVRGHLFVTSVSIRDVQELLTREYARIAQETDRMQFDLLEQLTSRIADFKYGSEDSKPGGTDPNELLSQLQSSIRDTQAQRVERMKPLTVLDTLIREVLKDKGVKVTDALTLGDPESAIEADRLSAGEKQVLSFLSYNAFWKQACIFIDEPELSLHVDWQRRILGLLQEQKTDNQFILATHSPFIYSKYPEKELALDPDRGIE